MILRAKILNRDDGLEHRGAERRVLRLNVSLSVSTEGIDATVHDLSSSGLRIETDAKLEIGEDLTVDLPGDNQVQARVVWHRDGSYGCEFFAPIAKGVIGAAVLRAPFDVPDRSENFLIEEVTVPSSNDVDELAQWYADFERRRAFSGEQLVGFRTTPDGQIIALIARLN